ncbi:MAG: DUF4832 domain-containing protein [Bacteroidales bacterium]|jgi:hypothetical protein|nr:DUF4832 domain-containing protein [Bacteroidales bacterium]
MKQIKIFITLLVILCCMSFNKKPFDKKPVKTGVKSLTTIEYENSDSLFPNPERGLVQPYDRLLDVNWEGNFENWWLNDYRNINYSLIYRCYYLNNFRDTLIHTTALQRIEEDFATLRECGFKVVLRFAYTWENSDSEPDASLEIILQHLDQLEPLLQQNSDVIAVLQAGFIGPWGEWHSSYNGLNNATSHNILITKLLEVLPANRMIQLRTPAFKRTFVERTTPIQSYEAFSGIDVARIGHHNDCFLTGGDDCGTYQSPVIDDKFYVSQDCLYAPIGGEMPGTGVGVLEPEAAMAEMRYLHCSFMYGIHDNLTDVKDELIKDLGYRFELISGNFTTEIVPGGNFSADITLKNVGYASLYNERDVELIFKNTSTNYIYKVKLTDDPRFWQSDSIIHINVSLNMPTDIPSGDYLLYLNLPDPAITLCNNPKFSIRLANKNIWEEQTGYNNLLVTINIDENNIVSINSIIKEDILIKTHANGISIETKEAKHVLIYSVSGQEVYQSTIEGNKKIYLKKGTYIVKTKNGSQKVFVW